MKLTLNQQEIHTAVTQYVKKVFSALDPNAVITVDMRAGRGDNGHTAEVDISMPEDLAGVKEAAAPAPSPVPAAPVPRRNSILRQPAVAEAPVPEPVEEAPVAAAVEAEDPPFVEEPVTVVEEAATVPAAEIEEPVAQPAPVRRSIFAKG